MNKKYRLEAKLRSLGWILFPAIAGSWVSARPVRAEAVEFKTSSVHGLVNYVEALGGDHKRAPGFLEQFKASRFNDARLRRRIEDFNGLRSVLNSHFDWHGYPEARMMGRTVSDILLIAAAHAKDLADLKRRASGLLPVADQEKLFAILKDLEPAYRALVWAPHEPKLRGYLARLRTYSRKAGIEKLFKRGREFYRSSWPENTPFTVVLYPIPGQKGVTKAEALGSVESVGVQLGKAEDMPAVFGTIFHEICHSLYEAQSSEVQKEQETAFLSQGKRSSAIAYNLINESLATALGNGIAYKAASGGWDKGGWYRQAEINSFGRALANLLETRFFGAQVMDAAFIRESVAAFERVFPEAENQFSFLMMSGVFLATDGEDLTGRAVGDSLRDHFKIQSLSRNSPADHAETRAGLGQLSPGITVVVAVSSRRQDQLKAFPVLKPLLDAKAPALFAAYDPQGRAYVALKVESASQIPGAVAEIKRIGKLDPAKPLVPLKLPE